MEKIVFKSIQLERAVSRLNSKVLALQTAVNSGCSVKEVNEHYAQVRQESKIVQQLAGEVRSGSFQIAAKYHFKWDI